MCPDFIQCEKWEEGLFSSTTKDKFPHKDDADYRYLQSFGAMMMYNVARVMPMLFFFMGWTIPLGQKTDLQNPFVPAALTISLLSLFWALIH